MQAPPTFLIFSSACLEKNLALTITGCLGRAPFPRTLKYPARLTSITGALPLAFFSSAYCSLVCSDTKDHNWNEKMINYDGVYFLSDWTAHDKMKGVFGSTTVDAILSQSCTMQRSGPLVSDDLAFDIDKSFIECKYNQRYEECWTRLFFKTYVNFNIFQ